jgi:hypothetical protein
MFAILVAAAVTRPVLARPVSLPPVVTGSAGYESPEEAQLDLSPGFTFEVFDLSAGAIAARLPFLVSVRHFQPGRGKVLRLSVSLDAAAPQGTRLSFQPSGSHGGTCRAGSLLPGASVQVFESTGGAVTGSCELRWSLDRLTRPRQAGATPLLLHWKLESVAVTGAAGARAPGVPAEGGTLSAGSHRPENPPASFSTDGRRPRGDIERPERRRPPS